MNPSTPPEHLLQAFVERHEKLFVLTGAGCSTDSGIPAYRDRQGIWQRSPPMTWQRFTGSAADRARYWARSMLGWRHVRDARPNATHRALAILEDTGCMQVLVTQNVDGLHQAGGNRNIIDLHGRLDRVLCLSCNRCFAREEVQQALEALNPDWCSHEAAQAPDGDAEPASEHPDAFHVPSCPRCHGMLKPDVVFFGENVPRQRLAHALEQFQRADAMLVLGSSLMVYSGYRFAVAASRRGMPLAAVNLGRNRADPLLDLKLDCRCDQALSFLDSYAYTSPVHA